MMEQLCILTVGMVTSIDAWDGISHNYRAREEKVPGKLMKSK